MIISWLKLQHMNLYRTNTLWCWTVKNLHSEANVSIHDVVLIPFFNRMLGGNTMILLSRHKNDFFFIFFLIAWKRKAFFLSIYFVAVWWKKHWRSADTLLRVEYTSSSLILSLWALVAWFMYYYVRSEAQAE